VDDVICVQHAIGIPDENKRDITDGKQKWLKAI
jgi:hypothetical protein